MTKVLALLLLALMNSGLLLGEEKEHQSSASPGNSQRVIDGSRNPELIPDMTAYRMYLVAAAQRPASSASETELFQTQMEKLGLSVQDAQTFSAISRRFIAEYEDLIRRHNDAITTETGVSDEEYAAFLGKRDELIQTTVRDLQGQLTPEGRARLDLRVNAEKRHMKISLPAVTH